LHNKIRHLGVLLIPPEIGHILATIGAPYIETARRGSQTKISSIGVGRRSTAGALFQKALRAKTLKTPDRYAALTGWRWCQ
jgi:hypothetical protein